MLFLTEQVILFFRLFFRQFSLFKSIPTLKIRRKQQTDSEIGDDVAGNSNLEDN
jgi:hypothetical protein